MPFRVGHRWLQLALALGFFAVATLVIFAVDVFLISHGSHSGGVTVVTVPAP